MGGVNENHSNEGYIATDPVGPGWMPILRALDADLRRLVPGYRISQAKEKFGRFTFYYTIPDAAAGTGADHAAAERVAQAERAADAVCERCGKPGHLRRSASGWVRTLCDSCETAEAQRMAAMRAELERP